MLKLKELMVSPPDTFSSRPPTLDMEFEVSHNVGGFPTTTHAELSVKVLETGKVRAEMTLDGLEADSLEEAREKMALWCLRTAAALSRVKRMPFDVPLYERAEFDIEALAPWLQREYAVLSERYKRLAQPDATETRSDIRADLLAQRHPLLFISGALDFLESMSYGDD